LKEQPYFCVQTKYVFQVEVFWVVTPCSVVAGYRRFRGLFCPPSLRRPRLI